MFHTFVRAGGEGYSQIKVCDVFSDQRSFTLVMSAYIQLDKFCCNTPLTVIIVFLEIFSSNNFTRDKI